MILRVLYVLIATMGASGGAPAVSTADFGIAPEGFTMSMVDQDGLPEIRAGAHPDRLLIGFKFTTTNGRADGNLKDMVFKLPSGLVGNPRAVVTCAREHLATALFVEATCPPESQIGIATLNILGFGSWTTRIFNAEPSGDAIAEFAFSTSLANAIRVHMRSDGKGFEMRMNSAVQDLPLESAEVELWGVPADHQTSGTALRQPFLTTSTSCDGPVPQATMRANSWQRPDVWASSSVEAGKVPVGCEGLLFEPQVQFVLGSRAADTPTGLQATVSMAQDDNPDGQAGARLRNVHLLLPEGVTLSPGAANGLTACSAAQAGIGSTAKPRCSSSARLGSVEIRSPLLGDVLSGELYFGGPLSGANYRVFLIAGDTRLIVKVEGVLQADPETGRLVVVLRDLPEVPVDRIELKFRDGPRAPLATPVACGRGAATFSFEPHGGSPGVAMSAPIQVDRTPSGAECPTALPFAPGFVAGSVHARAAAHSSFSMTIRRRDGEQPLNRFRVKLPPGLAAHIARVPRCATANGACSSASRVGSVVAEVGPGASPFLLVGDVFLTGAYRRGPFGFALVFDGRIGPLDLGEIVVRARLLFDEGTGQVTVDSDALPRVMRGIPLRVQTVGLDIDRPGFVVNPSSCRPMTVTAVIESAMETVTRPASRFAVGNCRKLRFRPQLAVALTGRRELRKGGHPGLRIGIGSASGGSNLRAANIRLPKLLRFDRGAVTAICSREQARDNRCPLGSRVGRAWGRTPLLSNPLGGSVYVVQPKGNGTPDLWAQVGSMGVSLRVRMETVVRRGHTIGKLVEVPDLALGAFTIRLASGKRGVLVTARSPCLGKRPRRMPTRGVLIGHSGARRPVRTRLRSPCAKRIRAASSKEQARRVRPL